MKKRIRRYLSLLLAVLMLAAYLPPASAVDGGGRKGDAQTARITAATVSGKTLTWGAFLPDDGKSVAAIAAWYAENGKLLGCKTEAVAARGELSGQTMTVAPGAAHYKLLLVDGRTYAPLCAAAKAMQTRWLLSRITMDAGDDVYYEYYLDSPVGRTAIIVNGISYLSSAWGRHQGLLKELYYDASGRLASILTCDVTRYKFIDQNGNEYEPRVFYEYDSFGKLIRLIDYMCWYTQLRDETTGDKKEEITEWGKIIYCEKIDWINAYTVYDYDDNGNIAVKYRYTEPYYGEWLDMNSTVSYEYDEAGNIIKETVEYDSRIEEVYHRNHIITYQYDQHGNKVEERTQYVVNGEEKILTWSYTYDAFGHMLSVSDSDGVVTTYTYNEDGLQSSSSQDGGNNLSFQYTYDEYGDLIQVICTDEYDHMAIYHFEYQPFLVE